MKPILERRLGVTPDILFNGPFEQQTADWFLEREQDRKRRDDCKCQADTDLFHAQTPSRPEQMTW